AGQLQNLLVRFREFAALDDFPRRALQIPGALVISEATPAMEHCGFLGRSKILSGGEPVQKFLIVGDHRLRTRLLQHDLRNQDFVGIASLAPWQIAPGAYIPSSKLPGEAQAGSSST